MPRILADLSENDIEWLDAIAAESGRSRAAVLREAVSSLRAAHTDWLERGFGLWTMHGAGRDGDEFEESVRAGWSTLAPGEADE